MRGHHLIGWLIIISLIVSLAVIGPAAGSQELIEVTLIQTLGVDGAGPVTLTAVAPADEEDMPQKYRTRGENLAQARDSLKELGHTRLEVTHVAHMVLGPDALVEEILWEELNDRASGCDARVWLTDGESAVELLANIYEPCKRLKALEDNGSTKAPTLLEALSTLTREGQVALPVLTRQGDDLMVSGTQIIKEG